jgi:membrane AbrB-like protein
MLGPLLTMGALRVSGMALAPIPWSREAGQWVIASALGLYFTPTIAMQVLGEWPFLLAGTLFCVVIAALGAAFLSKAAGVDGATAFFASVPGGSLEMSNLAQRAGGRADLVAVAQSLRILIVVLLIPSAYGILGLQGTDTFVFSGQPFDGHGLALLLGAAFAGGAVLHWLRVPNAWMLGPLFISVALRLSGVSTSSVPTWALNASQVFIGVALGVRFQPDLLDQGRRFSLAVVASVLGAMTLTALVAASLGWWAHIPVATAVLATAPGGMADMCLAAKVMRHGVPLVTAAHVIRVVFLVIATSPIYRTYLALRRSRRH